jgi:hypothetical protein
VGARRLAVGRLLEFNASGKAKVVADVGHFNFLCRPTTPTLVPGQFPDANPYGVLAVGASQWVVDAGTNTINRVRPNGKVSVEQFIPNPASADSVPTCIDRGPDGAFYVGELTGGGNPPGSAAVWRFAPGEATPLTQWATGLTTITGCGFGADGNRRVAVRLQLEYRSCGHRARLRDPDHAVRRSPAATARTFPRRRRPAVD